ncbi:MAG: hypothetical protein ABIM32_06355 [candidate division WOR-3 bacterium]
MEDRGMGKVVRDEEGYVKYIISEEEDFLVWLDRLSDGCWTDISEYVVEKDGKRFVESTVAKVFKKVLSGDWFAIITAYRKGYSREENRKRQAQLLRDIRVLGLAFTPYKVKGFGQGVRGGKIVDVEVYAWFLFPDIGNRREFRNIEKIKEVLKELAMKYEQDCFIVGQLGKDNRLYAELIGSDKDSGEWKVWQEFRYMTHHFDKFVKDVSGRLFYTELRGREVQFQEVWCKFWDGNYGAREIGVMGAGAICMSLTKYEEKFRNWIRPRQIEDYRESVEMGDIE